MDPEPEQKSTDTQETEQQETGQATDELTTEDIQAAFGWRAPRWAVPAIISVAAVLVLVIFWRWGGRLTGELPGGEESLEAAESRAEPGREGKLDELLSQEGMTITPAETTKAAWLLESDTEEFFMILNAQVGDEETEVLHDSAFYAMLFEPLIPMTMPPAPARTAGRWPVPPGYTPGVAVDTTSYLARIDSLERVLMSARRDMTQVQGENQRLQRRFDQLASAADSAKASEVRKLARVLESMNPTAAAAMLQNRRSDELAELLFTIKPRTAAKILQALPPGKSEQIASRIMK